MKKLLTYLMLTVWTVTFISCSRNERTVDDVSAPLRADNISNQFVYTIAEDSSGQIWIGTFRGLNRFNSRDFFQYYSTGDSSSLADNQIRCLLKTRAGEFYIGTVQGVNRRDRRDRFETIDLGAHCLVGNMVEMADSTIMIEANSSLFSYRPDDRKAERLLDEVSPGNQFAINLHVDDADNLWITGENTIRLYDRAHNVLTDSIPVPFFSPASFKINGHEIWLVGERLMIFDTRRHEFVELPAPLSNHPVLKNASFELVHPYGDEGILLLTSANGMYYYDMATGSVVSQYDSGFPFSVPDFKIKTMFTDSRRNIWFGGHDQGIAVHYHYTERFNHNKFIKSALENKSVVSLTADKENNLWMATRNDGVYVFDHHSKAINQIPMSKLTKFNSRYDDLAKSVFADSAGNIWILLTSGEALKCSYEGQKLSVLDRYPIWGAMSVNEDSNGTIWITAASPYVFYLRKGQSQFTPLQVFDPGYIFVPDIEQYDDENMIAAAFNQSVKLININTMEVSPLPVAGDSFNSMLSRSVFIPTDIRRDGRGYLWLGTIANGLLRYDPSDSTFTAVRGISSDDISAISLDENDDLWVSTLNGLTHFNPVADTFEHFFERDGTGGNQFYDRSSTIDSAGNIYFGGTHGITSFMPCEVDTLISAPVIFQNLIVHNKAVQPGTGEIDCAMEYCPDIHLDHSRNSFGISFVAVDYCDNPRVVYRYMMEGIDHGWIEASDSREAYYANVAPGSYNFRVGLVGNDDSIISIKIFVKGPWWTSWWAIIIYCLIFGAIAGLLIMAVMKIRAERAAVHRARLEKEREQHINDMNMRFFSNISHEFRTPLTMIAGPIKQMSESSRVDEYDRRLLSIANVNVTRMLNLVNQLLDFNKIENDTLPLEVSRIDIAELLRQISDMFAVHAAGKDVKFTLSGCQENCFITGDADKISKITSNLLSNAFKFTPRSGSVTMGLDTAYDSELGECIKIYVRNTGDRIPSDKLEKIFERYYQLSRNDVGDYNCGSGIGLYYSRALATIHHGRLTASDNLDFDGAEFVLLLPVDPDVYAADRHKQSPTQLDKFPLSTPPGGVSPVGVDTSDSSERPLILVVDDDVQVAEYLRTLLSVSYRVVSRFDAETALSWLDENIPSLIISDVVMPGKDGYEFCKTIKHDIRFSHIPVILLTAKATVENQIEGLEAEADAYVTKPFGPAVLMSQIGSLLSNREKARQLITSGTTIDVEDPEILSPQDSAFLKELYDLMEAELANCELDVNEISRQMLMSRTKFYYKVKGLTGEPPSVFFKTYKLNRAAELIREHKYTLSEISDMTGFSSLSHFSRSFKKQFGVAPTAFKTSAEQ